MQHTTCTEDRIHHALERCLHGLGRDAASSRWAAGLCLNCWSLQELVSRDAGNYLILVEKILAKTKEVQERCDYDLVTPLALLFYSAVLCAPHLPPGSELLLKAASVYHGFLTWPVPYCDTSRELLTFISNELKAPGITFQRLVRTEQGLPVRNYQSSTVAAASGGRCSGLPRVPRGWDGPDWAGPGWAGLGRAGLGSGAGCVPRLLCCFLGRLLAFLSVGSTLLLLLQHLYQATFGTCCDLDGLGQLLKSKPLEELSELYASAADAQEAAAASPDPAPDPALARERLQAVLRDIAGTASFPAIAGEAQPRKLHPFPIPPARCYTYSWDQDNFDILNDVLSKECSIAEPLASENEEEDEEDEEEEEEDVETDGGSPGQDSLLAPLCALPGDSVYSVLAEEGSKPPRVSLFASPKESISELTMVSRKSLKSFVSSLKDCMDSGYAEDSDESSLDVARAYSRLRLQESSCPSLTRYFRLQFFYVPVKRSCVAPSTPQMHHPHHPHHPPHPHHHPLASPGEPPPRAQDPSPAGTESSTNDISHYLGLLDPWYERNVLGLMSLPMGVLCQCAKPEAEPQEEAQEQLPILADMILYYCRFASRPVLLQLYQTELTFIGGEKRTEVFIHSLELGHSAATRAIKASGPGSKRLGIDGDREAIPLTLQIAYSKTAASGRGDLGGGTSVNLSKACRRHEELASKTECLNLTMTEVVKRQNSKSKKSFNQISVSQIKVDKAQIIGVQSSFAVCLDQDEQKILQSVTRCEISVCYKPRDCDPLAPRGSPVAPQDPSEFQSLLCLPIATFSGALP
ncbi:phosphoinositide 3-kinase regulatory subunit 5 [Geospiza fortis]|uniref:Phosphoinositide 3-kinase regulatory subunit 5 n=1 Tax=Geospiza fortis TaxID=48883 RepID=A0A8N5HVT4_GEOFO|nr:phosphoinositide 3-kinase regulatory subunit 5 [Geospiza fortis]